MMLDGRILGRLEDLVDRMNKIIKLLETLLSVQKGLQDAKEGKLHDRGSFSQYIEDK